MKYDSYMQKNVTCCPHALQREREIEREREREIERAIATTQSNRMYMFQVVDAF
jgi:hypothetical protein